MKSPGTAGSSARRGHGSVRRWKNVSEPASKRGLAADFEGLAGTSALTGGGRDALIYLGAAQALREESGSVLLPADQAILDRLIETGLAPITEGEREQALAEGRNRPLDQVIAQALND